MKCLFVSSDLFSSSQFASAIRQAGVEVQAALAPPAAVEADCGAVVVDLETAGAIEAIAAFAGSGRPVIAFGPHVKVGLLDDAQRAGAKAVLSRGQAMRDLGPLVKRELESAAPRS